MAEEEKTQKTNEGYMSRLDLKRRSRWGRVRETEEEGHIQLWAWPGRRDSKKQDPGRDQSEGRTAFAGLWRQQDPGSGNEHYLSSFLFHFLQPDNPQKRLPLQKISRLTLPTMLFVFTVISARSNSLSFPLLSLPGFPLWMLMKSEILSFTVSVETFLLAIRKKQINVEDFLTGTVYSQTPHCWQNHHNCHFTPLCQLHN